MYNPPESGDDKHVIMRLESFSTSALTSVINAGLFYDFTIQKFDPTAVTATTAPTTTPLNAAQSGVTFTVNLYSTQTQRAAALFDYFILEFPSVIQQPLGVKCTTDTANTDCVSLPGNNWVIYDKSDADVAANTYLTDVVFRQAQQVAGVIPTTLSVLTSYAVRNRVAITKVTYPPIDYSLLIIQTITASVAVPSLTTTQIPYSAPLMFQITFTVPSGSINIVIPTTGAIEIGLPSTISAIDSYCSNDDASQYTDDYGCTLSGQVFTIQSFSTQVSSGTVLKINFWAQATTASITPIFRVTFYQDAAKTMKISENINVVGLTVSAYKGFQKLYPIDTDSINPFAARAGDILPFKFLLTPGASFSTSLTVQFPTGVSVPTGASLICGFNTSEAKSCVVTTASPLLITIEAPYVPTLTTSTTYQVFISSIGSTATNKKGLIFANSGKEAAQVTVGSTIQSIPFEVYTTDFTSCIVRPLWSNAAVDNYLAVTLQPSVVIPQGGKIVIQFPQYALDNTALFSANLGTGIASGSAITCSSESKSTTFIPLLDEIQCTLFYVTNGYTTIEITGFAQVSTSSLIEFFIGPFKNPSTADTAHVHLEVFTTDASNATLNKRLLLDVFTPQTVTITPVSGSYTRTKSAVQATGSNYVLSSLTLSPSRSITTRSSIIIKFPNIFTLSGSITVDVTAGNVATPTTFKTYANFVVITPTADFPAGAVAVTLSGLTNPISLDDSASSGIHTYMVYYRSYETDITSVANPTADFTYPTMTVASFSASSQVGNVDNDFSIELNVGLKIPVGGVLKVSLPSFLSVKDAAISAGPLAPITYTVTSGTSPVITFLFGRAYDPSNGNIICKITAVPPTTSGTYTFAFKAFSNAATTVRLIATGTQTYQVTSSVTPAYSASLVDTYALQSSLITLKVNYVVASAVTLANINEIRVNLGTYTSVIVAGCQVNGVSTNYCGYDGAILVMGGGFTLNAYPTVNVITFITTAPSAAGIGRLYISTAKVTRATSLAAVIGAASAVTIQDMGAVYATIYAKSFSSFSLTTAHLTAAQPNYLTVSMKTGSTVINSPVFYIELPDFPANLGSYSNGNSVPCASSATSTLQCLFEAATLMKPARVRVNGYPDLAASTTVTFNIFRIYSPSTALTTNAYVKLFSGVTGNFESSIYGDSESLTFTTVTVSSPSSTTLTLSSGYLVRQAQSYTLSTGSSLSSGNLVFYHLPYVSYGVAATTPTCTISCNFYPQAGVITVPYHFRPVLIRKHCFKFTESPWRSGNHKQHLCLCSPIKCFSFHIYLYSSNSLDSRNNYKCSS